MRDLAVRADVTVEADTPISSGRGESGTTVLRIGPFLHAHLAVYVDDADARVFLRRLRDECDAALARLPGPFVPVRPSEEGETLPVVRS